MSDLTFLDTIGRQARERPDAVAFRIGEQRVTFAEFDRATNRLGNALLAMGIRRGDRVAALTRFHHECSLLTFAAAKIGAVCMPVNWRLTPDEVTYIVDNGGARFMMADDAFLALCDQTRLPSLERLVRTEGPAGDTAGFQQWYASAPDRLTPVPAQPEDPMLQLYSSGTTGLPKGVVLTHGGLIYNAQVGASVWRVDERSVIANALPTFHIAGVNMTLFPLYTGAVCSSYPEFEPAAFIEAIGRHGITHLFIVPAMMLFMLQSPGVRGGDYRHLQLMAYGGSPISDRVLTDAMAVFGCGFMQVYGMTELSGSGTILMPQDHQTSGPKAKLLRSAGRPIPGLRLRIVDPVTLADLPEGRTGEVWIESPGNLLEYWRNPEATRQAFPEGRNERGGWLRSGDGGYLEDGYLYINDRIKDMIISGGENIYPAEIENVLMMHPAVADAAIIGVPDETWGESGMACVVRRPGAQVSERELIDWLRERLAHYKCPRSVAFIEALPRNPSGKVLKRILREPYWQGRQRAVH